MIPSFHIAAQRETFAFERRTNLFFCFLAFSSCIIYEDWPLVGSKDQTRGPFPELRRHEEENFFSKDAPFQVQSLIKSL